MLLSPQGRDIAWLLQKNTMFCLRKETLYLALKTNILDRASLVKKSYGFLNAKKSLSSLLCHAYAVFLSSLKTGLIIFQYELRYKCFHDCYGSIGSLSANAIKNLGYKTECKSS